MSSSSTAEDPPVLQYPFRYRTHTTRVNSVRNNVQSILVGRGRNTAVAGAEGTNAARAEDTGNRRNSEGGPKTPRFTIMMPALPSTRLIIPYLRRSISSANRGSHSSEISSQSSSEDTSNASSAHPSPSITPGDTRTEYFEPVGRDQMPEPVVTRQDRRERHSPRSTRSRSRTLSRSLGRSRSRSRISRREIERHAEQQIGSGAGPGEQDLADIAAQGRRRRERRKRRPTDASRTRSRATSAAASPAQHLSRRKQRVLKRQTCRSTTSGVFLMLLLIIYLSLALTNKIKSQEFHVIIILVILITTVFFCHSLLRLCVILIRPGSTFERDSSSNRPDRFNLIREGGGYANPEHPIRVQILRDEEAAGIESEATKVPPPAYGLWRESVRVDPNRIYWARNTEAVPEVPSIPRQHLRSVEEVGGEETERPVSMSRPPSYISEDGITYVVEAQGRSIAPPSAFDVPGEGITIMPLEHAHQVTRDVGRRSRGISLSHARAAVRTRRQDAVLPST